MYALHGTRPKSFHDASRSQHSEVPTCSYMVDYPADQKKRNVQPTEMRLPIAVQYETCT